MKLKHCKLCNTFKSIDDFPDRKSGKDGKRTTCRICNNAYERKWRAKNPDKRAKKLAYNRQYNLLNAKKIAVRKLSYYFDNGEELKAYRRQYCKGNRGKCNALLAKRKAALLLRTPKWADLDKISEFYTKCPPGYEVDHTIPLQGKIVSGLHVLENLQYLPKRLNRIKKNKFPFSFDGNAAIL